MNKAIIFDFDGTIAETIPLTLQAIRAAYADNSLPVPTEETIVSNFGANEYGMFYKMSPDCADKLFESYLSEYAALHEKYSPKPFEGIVDVLHKIKNSGWKLGLVSNKPTELCRIIFRHFKLEPLFAEIIGGSSGFPLKPAPIIVGIFASGMPTTIARIREIPIRAMKGCSLNLLIATIITTIAITNEMIRPIPLILSYLLNRCVSLMLF